MKTGLKVGSQQKESFSTKATFKLLHKRLESPSVLMGRQIRALLIMSYSTNEKVWYKKNKESNPERAEFYHAKRSQYSYNK